MAVLRRLFSGMAAMAAPAIVVIRPGTVEKFPLGLFVLCVLGIVLHCLAPLISFLALLLPPSQVTRIMVLPSNVHSDSARRSPGRPRTVVYGARGVATYEAFSEGILSGEESDPALRIDRFRVMSPETESFLQATRSSAAGLRPRAAAQEGRAVGRRTSVASAHRRRKQDRVLMEGLRALRTREGTTSETDSDGDVEDRAVVVPFKSIFSQAFAEPQFRLFWSPFVETTEEAEQRRLQELWGAKSLERKKGHRHPVPAEPASDAVPPTAAACLRRLSRSTRSMLRRYGPDSAFLASCEASLRSHFGSVAQAYREPFVVEAAGSFQRIFVHALASFYGLRSESHTIDDRRLTFVRLNDKSHLFLMPQTLLSQHLLQAVECS